jgi:hypothetical protein
VDLSAAARLTSQSDLRVGASVGHGEKTGLVVLLLEVLIGELLTVDGTTTSTLLRIKKIRRSSMDTRKQISPTQQLKREAGATNVVAGEVTTLEHELGNDTVEARVQVALALGKLAKLTEVLGGLGDNIVEEVEGDTTSLG